MSHISASYLYCTGGLSQCNKIRKRSICKGKMQMVNRHLKRCSTLLNIRKMQIKTIIRYHLIPIRMASIKKNASKKCW